MVSDRWGSYKEINDLLPEVRRKEIDLMISKINPQPGERIIDFGCGSGVLTHPLTNLVGPEGFIYAFDVNQDFVNDLNGVNLKSFQLTSEILDLPDSSVDAVVSLAAFHHVTNKALAFKEFYRVLKPGGRLIIGDVPDNSISQVYFDKVVNPFCSTGHDFKFLNESWVKDLCFAAGFKLFNFEIASVPWVFTDEAEACKYLNDIHHLIHHSPKESLINAEMVLGSSFIRDKLALNWKLFYLVARK